jgi:hypothetical protein
MGPRSVTRGLRPGRSEPPQFLDHPRRPPCPRAPRDPAPEVGPADLSATADVDELVQPPLVRGELRGQLDKLPLGHSGPAMADPLDHLP